MATPAHLQPEACHVCGYTEESHGEAATHDFWSNADAEKFLNNLADANTSPEARYVEEYRPY